jgi:uracil-DNA glycosylase family 4
MRAVLNALTDELRRLKVAGVQTVAVPETSVAALRAVLVRRARDAGAGKKKSEEESPETALSPTSRNADREPGNITERATVLPRRVSAPSGLPAPRSVPPSPSASAPALPPPPVVTLPAGDKAARWAALRELVINHPVCAANVRPGKKVVLGVGSLDARIMFVGEAPGADEEIQGEPFVGPAGQLLTKMIQGMGLKREEVYIGNIMNWRPQMPVVPGQEQVGNRPPTAEEMAFCLPFLRAQVEIVAPALLVALGKTATDGLLGAGKFKTLGEARGQWHEFAGLPVMVTYHPSYILREPTPKKKRLIWEDLLKVMERAGLPISEKQRGFFLER